MLADGEFEEGQGEINLVGRMLYGIAVAELEMPHIVLTRSPSGESTYSGPYPSGLEALAAADAEWQVDRDAGGRGEVSFCVAALYPPLDVAAEDSAEDSAEDGAEPPACEREHATPAVPLGRRLVERFRKVRGVTKGSLTRLVQRGQHTQTDDSRTAGRPCASRHREGPPPHR